LTDLFSEAASNKFYLILGNAYEDCLDFVLFYRNILKVQFSLRYSLNHSLLPKGANSPHSYRTFIPLIIIMVLAVGLSLLSYQYSILTSEKISTIATQNLKENARVQAYDTSKSLENRLESVRDNLEILSNAPLIQLGEYSQARVLVNTAENTTEGFTDSYFWIDETGKLQWAGSFVDQQVYDQYYGADRTDRPYFTEPRDTHQPYFSTLRDSVDGVPRIYTAYPILASKDSGGTFKGVVVASMNLMSLGNSVTEQLPPDSQGAVSLLDRNGTVLYTQNEALLGKNYFSDEVQNFLFTNYIPANQKDTFNAAIRNSIAGNSGTAEYSSSGVPLILAYNPVMFDQGSENKQHAMTLHLTLPKAFASDIALLIEQQRNLSTIVPAAIGAVAVAIALMIIRWNSRLERTVKERTAKLETANEQLEAKERAQREFINIAAHELRTPIQPILGLSEIIRERILNLAKQMQRMREEAIYRQQDISTVPTQSKSIHRSSSLSPSIEKIVPMVDAINRNAKRLEKLTNNLLDVSRIENNKSLELSKERFDVRQKIESVINDMRNTLPVSKDVQIRFESKVRKASVMIEGDKERIVQVISNLLSNAIKFTEAGEIVVVLDQKDGQTIVSVRDRGSGISAEIYPSLFTKFVTKSEKGTGLGLFIAKSIVEAHGGKIWAENNRDGRGATFTFTLPTLTYDTEDMANEANE
jgi:signal transduction histidine kinase